MLGSKKNERRNMIVKVIYKMKATITVTFSECVENHKRMQMIGKKAKSGFTCEDLRNYQKIFENIELECEYHDLSINNEGCEEAAILIVRNVLDSFNIDQNELWDELFNLEWDKKALMYGEVRNKNARHNLCFADFNQEPEYKKGKGTVVDFNELSNLNNVRDTLRCFLGEKAKDLYAEGNLYYDHRKCYIGWHGDTERRKVIGLRLGDSFPLCYRWYQNGNFISDVIRFTINGGDMYIMSDKATGNDWNKKKIPTLRHAAGEDKKIKI